MVILRTVADKQEHPCQRQPFNQMIKTGLGLAVDPVQVLDHQDQGLDLARAQQQLLDGVDEALPALQRVEGLPLGSFEWPFQEC